MTGEEVSQDGADPSGSRPTTTEEESSRGADPPPPPDPWSDYIRDQMWRLEQQGKGKTGKGYYNGFRGEWGSGYDPSHGRRNSGWLSDGEIRDFNVAQVQHTTAMNNGRWAGSYDTNELYDTAEPYGQDWRQRWQGFGGEKEVKPPTEKISVPEFSGDGANDQEVGKSARSYVRKVQVWLRCTRLPLSQRALALYSSLSERAWVYAEELDMDILGSEVGVDYFLEWIQTRFMEVEVTKISQLMSDLFRRCKKRPEQSVREFNVDFERLVLRLHEVRCELPPLVKAWLYVDKLRLNEAEELALLASCNNEYDCRKLQQAALIQDRALRHGFGGGGGDATNAKGWKNGRWKQSVHMTNDVNDEGTSDDEPNDESAGELVDEMVAQEHHSAYMAYQGAKARYKEALKGRGVDTDSMKKRAEERLRLAKERSYCSACKRRGHWHKDEICPLRKGAGASSSGKPEQEAHVTEHSVYECRPVQECFMATNSLAAGGGEPDGMLAIVDTACTRSVAGYPWFEKFYEMADALELPFEVVEEAEDFRFGASKIVTSEFAVKGWFAIQGKWFKVKIAIVPCAVPLLFSRPVLAKLGMKYDLAAGTVTLSSLGVVGLKTHVSETGHPALLISHFPEHAPPRLEEDDGGEVWVPDREVYMSVSSCSLEDSVESVLNTSSKTVSDDSTSSSPSSSLQGGSKQDVNKMFYPKKIPVEVHNMLIVSGLLSGASFFSWWSAAQQSNDFWIETDHEMIRVHVTPRRHPFDPSCWKTPEKSLKETLLEKLTGVRITEAVPCLGEGTLVNRHEDQIRDKQFPWSFQQWIGRSRFPKSRAGETTTSLPSPDSDDASAMPVAFSMEDAQGPVVGRTEGQRSASACLLDSPGVAPDCHRDSSGRATQGGRESCTEGTVKGFVGRVDSQSDTHGDPAAIKAHERMADEGHSRCGQHSGRDCGLLREVQGLDVSRGTTTVPGLGCGRDRWEPQCFGRPSSTGQLGPAAEAQSQQAEYSQDKVVGNRSGSTGEDPTSVHPQHVRWTCKRRFVVPSVGAGSTQCRKQAKEGISSEEPRDQRAGRDQLAEVPFGHAGSTSEEVPAHGGARCGGLNYIKEDDEATKSIDKSVYEDMPVDEVAPKFFAANVSKGVSKPFAVNSSMQQVTRDELPKKRSEFVMMTSTSSDVEDFVSEEPFVPEERYYSKTMNPKVLRGEEAKKRAIAGIRQRKLMNEPKYKKVKRSMVNLATVFATLTMAMAGWSKDLMSRPFEDTFEVLQPFVTWATTSSTEKVDCLELFAGKARISEGFAKRGRGVLQPRDILYGHDLRDPRIQEEVLNDIRTFRPGLLWIAFPCTLWCAFSRLNFSPQELRRLRKKERELLEFIKRVILLQRSLGGMVVVENPRTSDLWRTNIFQELIVEFGLRFAHVDLCAYGMRSKDGEAPLKKSVSLLTDSEVFVGSIERRCAGDHEHRVVQGKETSHSSAYPTAFATAVFHAYNKAKASVTNTAYAVAASSSAAGGEQEDGEDSEMVYGAQAISFKGKVNPEVASVLKRVHQNLGHPPNKELVKHLKIAGASENVLRAAEQLVCRTCAKSTKAPLHKVSAPVAALDFNEAVALDIIWLDTVDVKNTPALNVVDLASTYQVVVPLNSTKSSDVSEAFVSGWIQWAGAPGFVLVDLDSAFKDKFLSLMDQKSIVVRAAAGQAHWQNGVAERHGGSWKLIWSKLVEDKLVTREELVEAAAFVSDAKNQLRNRSGYSPRQWVFGSNGRQPHDLLDMDAQEVEAMDLASPDDKFARTQVLRVGAKAAFYACQSKEAVQRAINHKPRVDTKDFETGDLVYAYREVRQGKGKKPKSSWLGPGVIIGREGSNFWLARGGRCILAAPEHLRTAHHEEVSEAIRLKTAMGEVKKLLDQPLADEEEIDEDYVGPLPRDLEQDGGGVEMEAEDESMMAPQPLPPAWEQAESREDQIRTSVRRARLLDDVPVALKRARTEHPQAVFMTKRCISEKGREKQLEKELPWGLIPYEERHLYREAELKQWKEHVEFGAVKALSLEESEEVSKNIPKERILNSRFAYKDKNHAARKSGQQVPCKPKARLCIAGHHDPDLGHYDMAVDAPTTSRHSILLAIQLGLARGWTISVGDIRAAFLNGVPAPRQLYFRQPRGGIPSLQPGQLVEVVKGVFGLSTSPKLWWMKLSKDLLEMRFENGGLDYLFTQNEIDPCVFQLKVASTREVVGLLLTHVDDLMLLVSEDLDKSVKEEIQKKFPVDGWQKDSFDYVGCSYQCGSDEVIITQTAYVEGRVDKVTAKSTEKEVVTREQVEENRTSIGSLSWLAKQTRPDLQFSVSQAQRKQANPSVEDLKKTNKLVDQAIAYKNNGVKIKKIPEGEITFVAFHDAAWGNVNSEDPDIGGEEWAGDHSVSSQLAHVIIVCGGKLLEGEESDFSLVDWRSKSSQRVCRSTFAGETMACCEALEHSLYLRSLFISFSMGHLIKEEDCGAHAPIHCITDCKSLYDHLLREGTPKAPTEKRLAIDLAGLRQILMKEARHQFVMKYGANQEPTPSMPCRPPIHWIPTELQLADILTKELKSAEWWTTMEKGRLFLPFKKQRDQYRFS